MEGKKKNQTYFFLVLIFSSFGFGLNTAKIWILGFKVYHNFFLHLLS